MKGSNTLQLDIVSAEAEIYSGKAKRLFATGTLGELEVGPGHARLLTGLLPGPARITNLNDQEELVYVTGGILEVQPYVVTILADTVVRARDFNEAEAVKAKQLAERLLEEKHTSVDYAHARAELARAAGLLKAIREMKRAAGKT